MSNQAPQKNKTPRFNASLPFGVLPPYQDFFAERIPLLQAFNLALWNHQQSAKKKTPLQKVLRAIGAVPMPFISAECGVFCGSSLVACAELARHHGVSAKMIGLDTFCGLPELSETDLALAPDGAPYKTKRLFTDTSLASVSERITQAGVADMVTLHQGLFSDTMPHLPESRYHFVNIDCDLFEPHLECLEYFYPRTHPGGVIFFDDYHSHEYPMGRAAIDSFLADKPERLFHLRFGADDVNRTKTFIIKY